MKKIILSLTLVTVLSTLSAQEITQGKEIDLGLPSRTIWAGWNIGAYSPEQYGDYYAWGEVAPKRSYNMSNYTHFDKDMRQFVYIGESISGTGYDVARQKWGGSWRIPSKNDFIELISLCKWTCYNYRGVDGYKVTGPNGNSIFFPSPGYRKESASYEVANKGRYWTSTLQSTDLTGGAYHLEFVSGSMLYSCDYGCCCHWGVTIRPVK